mmetsp:Transcript_7385/g.12682  ORF Transcript_7385/g.12682 Transcript_7385/m.12682 type:complete len:112 (+) Transcript_7385:188-523(+)
MDCIESRTIPFELKFRTADQPMPRLLHNDYSASMYQTSGTFLPPDCRLSFLPPALCNSFCWALVLLDAAILDVSIQCMAVPGRHKKALQPSVHNILWTVWIASSPEPSLLN